jgi:hypothetical protein
MKRSFRASPKWILATTTTGKLILAPFLTHADINFYARAFFAFQYLQINPVVWMSQYGPATGWMFSLTSILAALSGASPFASPLYFNFVIKLPLIFADTFVGYLIFRTTGSSLRTALWAFSPISFDAIVVHAHPAVYFACSLLICLVLLRRREFKGSALWLGVTAVFQWVGFLLVPLVMMELRRFAPGRVVKACSVYLVGGALFVSLPLLAERYGGGWFVERLTAVGGPVAFAVTGVTSYRGADLNLLEFLKFDVGLNAPSFIFMGSVVFVVVLLAYLLARSRLPTELWVTVLLVGIFLVYPQLHVQHLLFALPVILISKLKARVALLYNLVAVPAILAWDSTAWLNVVIRNSLGLTVSYAPNLAVVRVTYFVTSAVLIYVLIEVFRSRKGKAHEAEGPALKRTPLFKLGVGKRSLLGCLILIILIGTFAAQLYPQQGIVDQSQIGLGFFGRPGANVEGSYVWTFPNLDPRYFKGYLTNDTTFLFDLRATQILPAFRVYFNSGLVITAMEAAGSRNVQWKPADEGAQLGNVANQAGKTVFTKTFTEKSDIASWKLDLKSIGFVVNSIILILRSPSDAVVEIDLLGGQTVQYADLIVNKTWSAHTYSLISNGTAASVNYNRQTFPQKMPLPIEQLMIRFGRSVTSPVTSQVAIDSLILTNAFLPAGDEALAIIRPGLIETKSYAVLRAAHISVSSVSLGILLNASQLRPIPILRNVELPVMLLSASAELFLIVSSERSFAKRVRRHLDAVLSKTPPYKRRHLERCVGAELEA